MDLVLPDLQVAGDAGGNETIGHQLGVGHEDLVGSDLDDGWRHVGQRHVDRTDALPGDATTVVVAQRELGEALEGVDREEIAPVGVRVVALAGGVDVEQWRDGDDAGRASPPGVEHGAGDAEGEISAGRVAGDGDVLGPVALVEQPAERDDAVCDRLGDRLGRHEPVADVEHRLTGRVGDTRDQVAVCVEAAGDEGAAMEVEDGVRVAAMQVADVLGEQPLAGAGVELDCPPARALMHREQPRDLVDQVRRVQVERHTSPPSEERADGVTQSESEKLGLHARALEIAGLGGERQMCGHLDPFVV
jgi:hypothetical protein